MRVAAAHVAEVVGSRLGLTARWQFRLSPETAALLRVAPYRPTWDNEDLPQPIGLFSGSLMPSLAARTIRRAEPRAGYLLNRTYLNLDLGLAFSIPNDYLLDIEPL